MLPGNCVVIFVELRSRTAETAEKDQWFRETAGHGIGAYVLFIKSVWIASFARYTRLSIFCWFSSDRVSSRIEIRADLVRLSRILQHLHSGSDRHSVSLTQPLTFKSAVGRGSLVSVVFASASKNRCSSVMQWPRQHVLMWRAREATTGKTSTLTATSTTTTTISSSIARLSDTSHRVVVDSLPSSGSVTSRSALGRPFGSFARAFFGFRGHCLRQARDDGRVVTRVQVKPN